MLVLLDVFEELLFALLFLLEEDELPFEVEEPLLLVEELPRLEDVPPLVVALLLVDEFPRVDELRLVVPEFLEVFEELLLVVDENLFEGALAVVLLLLVDDELGVVLLEVLLEVIEEPLEFKLFLLYVLLDADLLPALVFLKYLLLLNPLKP